AEVLDGALAVEERLQEGQPCRVGERSKALGDDLEGLARERSLRRLARHRQPRRSTGAAQVEAATPPAAQVAAPASAGPAAPRFPGILSRRRAMPHVPVAPANVNPAPMKAARPRNHGWTSTPRPTPSSTTLPAMSCTCRSTGSRLRPSRRG